MSIPTKADHDIAEIGNLSAGILNMLRVMERCAVADLPRHRSRLRDMLVDYNSAVMLAARDG
jgi:hypothetical protein